MENYANACSASEAGVRYGLFTIYPFLMRKLKLPVLFNPYRPLDENIDIAATVPKCFKHCILDSGVFSLIYGAAREYAKERKFMELWYDEYARYVAEHNIDAVVVEYDCQKILGVETAWNYRRRLSRDLPNHRIMHVVHLEDKYEGLLKIVDFTDYLGVPVSEWRANRRATYVSDIQRICNIAKARKPDIDIHLLGCTEPRLIRACRFCTSCDSTSWLRMVRYGSLNGYRRRNLSKSLLQKTKETIPHICAKFKKTDRSEDILAEIYLSAKIHRSIYQTWFGDQS